MLWSAPQADRSHPGLAHVVLPCPIQFRPSQNPGSLTPPPLRYEPILKPLWIFSLDSPQHWAPLPFREPGSSKMSSPPPTLSALSRLECHKFFLLSRFFFIKPFVTSVFKSIKCQYCTTQVLLFGCPVVMFVKQ